jgi:hypothetical protein
MLRLCSFIKRIHKKEDRYDDEIDFQWGDTKYDCSFIDEKGGKYHRKNPDGSITEFKPPALRCKTAVGLVNERFYFDVIKKWSLLKMKTIEDALAAERFIYNSSFLTSRWVSAKANGKLLEISAMNVVLEATYFPSSGPDSD